MPEMPSKEEHENTYNHEKEEQIRLVWLLIPYHHGFIKEKCRSREVCKFKKFGKFYHGVSSSKICTPTLDLDRKLVNS